MQPGHDANHAEGALDASVSNDNADASTVAPADRVVKTPQLRVISDHSTSDGDSESSSTALAKALQFQFLAARQAAVLQITARYLDQNNLQKSVAAVCESLHRKFNCTRVVAGLIQGQGIDVVHISQQSSFDARSGEILLLKDAMQEANEQDQIIHFVVGLDASKPELTIVESHRAVLSGVRSAQISTIPLCNQDQIIGTILLEAHEIDTWSPLTIELQKQIAQTLAPLIALQQKAELGLYARFKSSMRAKLKAVGSPRQVGFKLAVVAGSLILLLASVLPVTHEINTTAELASTERRLVTSPILGYVQDVHIAVGDNVKSGQALLDLDVKDLQLQAEQYLSQIHSAEADYRAAMASHDRKEMAIVQAQLDQIRSEFQLVDTQINRSQIVAPIDGVIVSGDLSQILGAPVERGATLLEVAPESSYQVQLLVNETDIGYVKSGNSGELTLKSDPFNQLGFRISSVHPMS